MMSRMWLAAAPLRRNSSASDTVRKIGSGGSLVRTAALALLLLGLESTGTPGAQAQDSIQTSKAAEGTVLHKSTKIPYYYRINKDSTVLIRQEQTASGDSAVTIPANTLAWIHERVEKQLLSPEWLGEYVLVGYEGDSLVLQFTQRYNLYVLGALAVLIVVGGGLLLWLWQRLSKEKRRREALAQSRRYLAKGREKERKRLAQEIHDGPVQDLHGLHFFLNTVTGSPDDDWIDEMGDELMRVTSELRAMSADLHPPALHRFGLAAALRSHAERLQERHADLDVDMDLTDDQVLDHCHDEFALSLFRIAQEAMNNAVQHGHADRIRVQLHCDEQNVVLDVRDDGDGFTPPDNWHALADHGHFGLLGMRERADAIGAVLDVESTPGEGTRIHLRGSFDSSVAENDPAEEDAPIPA